jgi:hypothetical protein
MKPNNCHIGKQYKLLKVKDKKEAAKLQKWIDSPLRITCEGALMVDTQTRYSWEKGE